ncbi:hypothetical protein BCR34DRAFT_560947 [Clohesyomyces aquaticus]|uniref:Uncharacterized protein n=1 Tax=Clohesyomyces aquaticus TaxID=1231657 RepID=A0A1Y1ZUV8_9PLEO|nr:hypothetical protein BCR34DRAFT_560947 [Clohesyomyces aquaticus]
MHRKARDMFAFLACHHDMSEVVQPTRPSFLIAPPARAQQQGVLTYRIKGERMSPSRKNNLSTPWPREPTSCHARSHKPRPCSSAPPSHPSNCRTNASSQPKSLNVARLSCHISITPLPHNGMIRGRAADPASAKFSRNRSPDEAKTCSGRIRILCVCVTH